jgi:hypothetical protein
MDKTGLFNDLPPCQQEELFRLVLHKAILFEDKIKMALYGPIPPT